MILPVPFPPFFAQAWGDDAYGLWADFTITTAHGEATQRLRWIEPGTFLMGSPEDEAERDDDEGPQHPVTLSEGFWLADTACTQALWLAVMGNNPSNFKDDLQGPVEQVSWDDVQEFLKMLEPMLPGCAAALPTEAEWEYACRAGTTTPFSFGEQISLEVVNYDGNHPYNGGATGEYRKRTVAVKSLPANPWGLFEMHGNVLEWCADTQRQYDVQSQEDSEPGQAGALRAVRGGSLIGHAGEARSACRSAAHHVGRLLLLGFRFALRSTSPGQARPGGPLD